jgi:hypothetical protein
MNQIYAERIAKALGSIAKSLAKLANPHRLGTVSAFSPEPMRIEDHLPKEVRPVSIQFEPGDTLRIVPHGGKVS